MKTNHLTILIPLLALSVAPTPVCQATSVFLDTFSQTPGTPLVGTSADIGGVWSGSAGSPAVGVSAENSLDTSGDARTLFNTFTLSLGAGELLTLSYDGLAPAGNFLAGWSGVSLYAGGTGGTEEIFVGDPATASWGLDGPNAFGSNHQMGTSDTSLPNHITFTYAYDTGAYAFSTDAGLLLSGAAAPDLALNAIRVANGNGGDINLDNLQVDISTVPEPASLTLLALGALGTSFLRRRRS